MMAGFESSLFPDPNPPRDIFIKKKTTKSIFVEWAPAFFMDDLDGFNYTVIISSSSGTADYNTKASYQNLTNLSSGTPHIICVRTTGPLGHQSESVCSGNVTTSKCSKGVLLVCTDKGLYCWLIRTKHAFSSEQSMKGSLINSITFTDTE